MQMITSEILITLPRPTFKKNPHPSGLGDLRLNKTQIRQFLGKFQLDTLTDI